MKAVVISFFQSTNLGDLTLSKALCDLVSTGGHHIVRCDFCTTQIMGPSETPRPSVVSRDFAEGPKLGGALTKKWFGPRVLKCLYRAIGPVWAAHMQFKVGSTFRRRRLWAMLEREITKADSVVVGGGNMLMDLEPSWPMLFRAYSALAVSQRKPFFVMYVGVGPLLYEQSQRLIRSALKHAQGISVRDETSMRLCRTLVNPNRVTQSADPVFAISSSDFQREATSVMPAQEGGNVSIGVCVLGQMCFKDAEEHGRYLDATQAVIGAIWRRRPERTKIVLFSTESADYSAVRMLETRVTAAGINCSVTLACDSFDEIRSFYGNLDSLIAGRMHAMIFAHKCLLPHIGIVWQEKVRGFAALTGGEGRMFSINEFLHKPAIIAEVVLNSCSNALLISSMHEKNKQLREVVLDGNFLGARASKTEQMRPS